MISVIFLALLSFLSQSTATSPIPVITEHPISTSVPRNSPLTLNCGVTGFPQPTVSWFKDGSPVKTGAGDHLMILPDGSLFFLRTVQNKKNQDSGIYHCQAENQHGVVLSKPATLTVTFLREKFGVVPVNIETKEGNDVKLGCLAPEGNPRPTIRWIKNGEVLDRKADSSGSLMLRGSRVADSGQYSCMATNVVGVRKGNPISLVVKPRNPPIVVTAKLIDSTTGLVKWLPQGEATGYMIRVSVKNQLIRNISLERDVTQLKLHSLAKDQLYTVQVSAQYGSIFTKFSRPHPLKPFMKEVILHSLPLPEDVPKSVWVLAMSVVVLVIILIIVAAAIIFHRTIKIRSEIRHQSQSHYQVGKEDELKAKKMNWMDRSWNFNTGSKVSSFGSNRGLIQDSHYDYAVPAEQSASYDYSYGYSVEDCAHYASSNILKQSYYLPLTLPKSGECQQQNSYRKYSQPVNFS